MKNLGKTVALFGAVLVFCVSAQTIHAQAQQAQDQQQQGRRGRGGNGGTFDPAQMQAQQMERYRTALEPKDDDEWKILEERITKVVEAQQVTRSFATGGFGRGGGGRGGPGGPGGQGGNAQGGRGGRGGEPNADVAALTKAIEDKAPKDEIKAKLAKVRDARKAADAKLEMAQSDLQKVLSVRQEAVSMMMGLLK